MIIFEDADLEAAVMGAISGIFAATGQTCIAGSRLLLQRSIHDRFVERLVEVAKTAKIGDPMSPETHVGPVTTAPQYRKVLDYIDGDETVLEQEPLKRLSRDGQLMTFKHEGFFYAMDTFREYEILTEMWDSGDAPWKIW